MGLEDFDYRSFFVPLLWTDPQNTPRPLTFDEGITRVAPDIVLVNQRLLEYFSDDNAQAAENGARFQKWMSDHHAEAIGRIDDAAYGRIEIYRIRD
jgi:hypothetical protein